MKKLVSIAVCLLASCFILTACSLLPLVGPSSTESTLQANQPVTLDFSLKDKDGNDVNLADYKGKKIYINVWATWCGPCQREIPELEEVYQEYKDKEDYVFLSITSPKDAEFANTNPADVSKDEILEKASELGATYPVLFDTKVQAMTHFGIAAFPTHILINSDGTLKVSFAGQVQKDKLVELLEEMGKFSK
ncbi:TlpA family protein disulfide reductase [Streptococcus suis]|uniref:TlpA family protein disulfide reductase n=1 Tax=Streptococcus suis TaxID=1307 RepID=UPI0003F85E58|nr:TlpA disulfide reductase family protein [Streptococcus suis]